MSTDLYDKLFFCHSSYWNVAYKRSPMEVAAVMAVCRTDTSHTSWCSSLTTSTMRQRCTVLHCNELKSDICHHDPRMQPQQATRRVWSLAYHADRSSVFQPLMVGIMLPCRTGQGCIPMLPQGRPASFYCELLTELLSEWLRAAYWCMMPLNIT